MAFNLPVQNSFVRNVDPTPWVRPADWPVITDAANEVQFLISDLYSATCVIRTQFTRTSGTQNIIIDWGDGTTTTVTSTAQTESTKTYIPGTGTPCSLGYTTFKIRVYFTGVGVSTLDRCQPLATLIPGDTASQQNSGLLEAYFGNGTIAFGVNFNSTLGNVGSISVFTDLKYVKFPASSNASYQFVCTNCTNLSVVVMPTTSTNLTLFSAFNGCSQLESVNLSSAGLNITDLASAFNGCLKLKSVTLPPSMNNCSQMTTAFNNCPSLKNITIPSVNSCTAFNSMFSSCDNLEWVKFTSMPTAAGAINFSNIFQNCYNLQNVYFPATGTATSIYNFATAFQNCTSLINLVFPSNINVSTFATAFNNCSRLISCVFPSNVTSCSTFTSMFANCYNLKNITLPVTVGANIVTTSMFSNCKQLESLTIPNTWTFSNINLMFQNCAALKTLNWTPGAQNSLTIIQSAFTGCTNLSQVNLPTSMTGLTNMDATFTNCVSLTSVTFPNTLNSVSSAQSVFNGCTLLSSVTLPTQMASCTNMSSIFQNCRTIRTITLPNVVPASINLSGSFVGCVALTTLTLPGNAQLSSMNNISSIFSSCSNLVTINNFDKIGSLTATPLVNASSILYNQLTSISFRCPLSILQLNGFSATARTNVQSVRLLNTSAGQWTGASPQINVSFTNMSTANLVQLFNDMAAQGTVTAKTINITSAVGAAGLTAADRLIVTSRGWTIIG